MFVVVVLSKQFPRCANAPMAPRVIQSPVTAPALQAGAVESATNVCLLINVYFLFTCCCLQRASRGTLVSTAPRTVRVLRMSLATMSRDGAPALQGTQGMPVSM